MDWISSYVRGGRRYQPPRGNAIHPNLRKEKKEVAGPYFQLLSGGASIGSYFAQRTGTISSSACWWCGSGKRKSRHHLFVQCRACAPQVQEL